VSAQEFEKLCESDKIRQSLIDSTNEGISEACLEYQVYL